MKKPKVRMVRLPKPARRRRTVAHYGIRVKEGRDQGKLVIRGVPEVWRRAFHALAIMRNTDAADLLVWLLSSHPEVKAREVQRGARTAPRFRSTAAAAR